MLDLSSILRQLAVSALPVLIAITFHEVSHGFVANKLGDPTARLMGRLTLNPLAHIDPVGTILLPFMLLIITNGQFVFGYAKPVPVNPINFKDYRKGMALTAAAGPATNLILAILSLLILKGLIIPANLVVPPGISSSVLTPLTLMFTSSIVINVVLASFNLMPIPPLDGGRVLIGLLPHKHAVSYGRIEPFGFIIVIALIATGLADFFVMPLVNIFLTLLKLF